MRKYGGYIVGLVGAILALIFALFRSNRNLKDKIGQLEGEKTLREKILAKEGAENDANDKESNYSSLRDEYLRSTDGAGGDQET